ncbi:MULTISPECIES: ECF transporter S component [Micromonospora]|uniref:Energy-coupling factor transport system substrate-specific component n=1 Tax=Micromonospora yangpuensis TaxID=683228 RepID=A0A1C6V5P1_9ACTN|nr:ECF transporter S component [Micromonospora yangpuensis]GGM15893.1 ABC transporter permease [Micromonospora yangpuensis]SCL61200.1 energy-coupling factor transport system substrate-specific component [Micromonospora yangpuensis]
MSHTDTDRWRTIDIVVASVIAVAFGVIFWAWNLVWTATEGAFAFFPPAQAVIYGIWLVPGVLGGLVIRKPGAAFYCEFLAAFVSVLLGSQWGVVAILQGAFQGVGAELGFAAFRYRSYRLPAAMLSATLAGLAAAVFDQIRYYAALDLLTARLPIFVLTVLSATVLAGVGGLLLTRALAGTGVLDRFPAGRDRALV